MLKCVETNIAFNIVTILINDAEIVQNLFFFFIIQNPTMLFISRCTIKSKIPDLIVDTVFRTMMYVSFKTMFYVFLNIV